MSEPAYDIRPDQADTTRSGEVALAAALSRRGSPSLYSAPELVRWAWGHAGVDLPVAAADQYRVLQHLDLSTMRPGDLLFYSMRGRADLFMGIDHVAMYVGAGMIVEASSLAGEVRVVSLASKRNPVGIARPGTLA